MNNLIKMFENTDSQLLYELDGDGFNFMLSGLINNRFQGVLFQSIIYNHRNQKLGIFNKFWREYNKTEYRKKQEFISYIENKFSIKILEVV